ncbi:bacterial Ig-like domain (group2) [Haloferula helveola]|uniref:Bacterial Ig-like domain (Group2) n=1 Tax=Haloferula helveola TaxID=490095 RepID=A0ABN6GYU2_9BACT|nr:bacterial Ig-like domain (group2) [Haloferula helveola]
MVFRKFNAHPGPILGVVAIATSFLCIQCTRSSKATGQKGEATAPEQPGLVSEESARPVSIPDEVTFNEHIQPILSEYCYQCHGPDEKTRYPEEEPLRLDLADEAFKPRENGTPVIIKGDAEASLLVKLLHSTDKDTVMPPPESHKELDATQIALLEAWVDQGAEYQDHWAFLPVERPEVPESDWGRNGIDPFVEARLRSHDLEPNPDEDPARLYRRLHFDLTGLPPSPEELDNFLKSAGSGIDAAYEAEVDRLLATTESAEHFARYWLDAARYADTHGIHIDNYRAIWPYRDWVIRALERNMPWDEFTIEQIAGDMLPDPTLDQQVATGFHRCLPTTGEGGAIAEEYLAIYAQDRTDTTGAVWLGLTMGCASCHDHKFDPISMKDTYSFNAFFRNTPMSALDRNNAEHPPNVFVPLHEDRPRFAALADEKNKAEEDLKARRSGARQDFDQWLAAAKIDGGVEVDSTLALRLPLASEQESIVGELDGQPQEWQAKLPRIDAPLGKAAVISEKPLDLGDHLSFSRSDQVTFGGFIYTEGKPTGAVIARMDPNAAYRGWDLYLQSGQPAAHVIDRWPDAASKIVAKQALNQKSWQHVMVTFDGTKSGHQSLSVYVDGKRVPSSTEPNTVGGTIETKVPLRLGSRHGDDSKLTKGKVALQDFRFYRRLLTPAEISDLASNALLRDILETPADNRTKKQMDRLFEYYVSSIDPPSIELRKKIDALAKEEADIRSRGSVSLVMEEKKDSEAFAHILNRGVYSDKGEKVTADTPASLPPMPEGAPKNRLGLAQWLVAKENPLPARVAMNRLWAQLFGTGIVETVGDFGIMGARPTHPKLLDWLASEFMDNGWDYRRMIKLMVMSSTYRQSATIPPAKLETDPSNALLSRGPRFRLDGEELRDMALAASDLLIDEVGGPPVKPYQPEGIWSAVAMPQSNTRNYKQDTGEKLYRRSIYTFWKRTAPHPAMEIFNAPTREVTCVARERTNTPLQAFVTLNDPQFVEASRRLAEHALSEGDFDSRLDFISTRLIARKLVDEERAAVRKTLDDATKAFTADNEAAKTLISEGESEPNPDLPVAEVAAWTIVSSQILNLDEALTK